MTGEKEATMNWESATIYDISPLLAETLAVFPGDVPYARRVTCSYAQGDSYELSSITASVHSGAHVDAPLHYHPQGQAIAQRSLRYYLGPCQVISPQVRAGEGVTVDHLEGVAVVAPRVLFRTLSFPDAHQWRDDFSFLTPEVISYLAGQGVRLVGIDTPSIDPRNSKQLECHQRIFSHDMAILEGVCLEQVKDGLYTLVALPLRLAGADASPVRAILIDEKTVKS